MSRITSNNNKWVEFFICCYSYANTDFYSDVLLFNIYLAGCCSFVCVCITSYINYVEWSLHIDYQIRG